MGKDKYKKMQRNDGAKDREIARLNTMLDSARNVEAELLTDISILQKGLGTALDRNKKLYDEHVDTLKITIDSQKEKITELETLLAAARDKIGNMASLIASDPVSPGRSA